MENNWISIKEKLPEIGTWVIGWDYEYKDSFFCLWTGQRWDATDMIGLTISHWMNKPQEPDKKE